jgi:hypothetical protein
MSRLIAAGDDDAQHLYFLYHLQYHWWLKMASRKEKRKLKSKAIVPGHYEKVTRRNVFAQAAIQRLQDSRVLLAGDRYVGAMYLGGYVIECSLKYLICSRYNLEHLEDWEQQVARRTGRVPGLTGIKGHLLEALLEQAGLTEALRRDSRAYQHFKTVNQWYVGLRYYSGRGNADSANYFLEAVESLYGWLLQYPFR